MGNEDDGRGREDEDRDAARGDEAGAADLGTAPHLGEGDRDQRQGADQDRDRGEDGEHLEGEVRRADQRVGRGGVAERRFLDRLGDAEDHRRADDPAEEDGARGEPQAVAFVERRDEGGIRPQVGADRPAGQVGDDGGRGAGVLDQRLHLGPVATPVGERVESQRPAREPGAHETAPAARSRFMPVSTTRSSICNCSASAAEPAAVIL